MQTEKAHANGYPEYAAGPETPECPSCHAALAPGTRFCRMCGYRLGEGVAEYAETRRFDAAQTAGAAGAGGPAFATDTYAPLAPSATISALDGRRRRTRGLSSLCRPKRMGWMGWMLMVIVLLTVLGVVSNKRGRDRVPQLPPHAALGLAEMDTADRGGTFIKAVIPGTPADRAGLVGGDIIVKVDGREVKDESALQEMLREMPPGTAVEVAYLRDGQTRAATLTTISSRELELPGPFAPRRGERGYMGIDTDEATSVELPGMNLRGVRLGDVRENRPGHIAGLRDGDVLVEFEGHLVRTEEDLVRRISHAAPESTVKVVVVRGGERLEIPVKLGRN